MEFDVLATHGSDQYGNTEPDTVEAFRLTDEEINAVEDAVDGE